MHTVPVTGSTASCTPGSWLGVNDKLFGDTLNGTCADWHWAVCKPAFLTGLIMQYSALGLAGLIVCCCTLCVCKCFCCKSKKKSSDRKLDHFGQKDSTDREPLLGGRSSSSTTRNLNSKSAERREAMRKKWGLDDNV